MTVGFAMCGSYCTYSQVFPQMEALAKEHTVLPIFAHLEDSRFGPAQEHLARAQSICGRVPLRSIADVEPIGPGKTLDALIVAPCTGNTLAKLANGIADTSITMAVKSQLRNGRPVLLAVSTNDGLSTAARNIGALLCRRNIYFVPFGQDDPVRKPRSLVAHFSLIPQALEKALLGEQIQPILR